MKNQEDGVHKKEKQEISTEGNFSPTTLEEMIQGQYTT